MPLCFFSFDRVGPYEGPVKSVVLCQSKVFMLMNLFNWKTVRSDVKLRSLSRVRCKG